MLPYLIAGAIGYVVAKLFEEDEAPKYANGGDVNNKTLMKNDFLNEQTKLQRNSKYAILLDAKYSNYTDEMRDVLDNLQDELIKKLGYNPLNYYDVFSRDEQILMFDDDSNLLGLLIFTIDNQYTIVPRFSPSYIKPEKIFENNENVFYIEYIFSFGKGKGQKMMNQIKKYANKYNVAIGLEGSVIEKSDGKYMASAKHLERFYDKQGFVNTEYNYFLYNPNSKLNNGGSVLLAPNGKPSNLSPEQYKLVRTPAFKNWFGDWENDSANASKVVDENGEPLVCYHGNSNINFNVFVNGELSIRGKNAKGWYFTRYKNIAKNFSGTNGFVKEVFLKIMNFKIAKSYIEIGTINKEYVKNAVDSGYDGAYFMPDKKSLEIGWLELYNEEFVAFEPNQIKLADGSNTTFDSNNPDIRFDEGGKLADNIFDYFKEKGFAPLGNQFWGKSNCTIKIDFSNVLYLDKDNRVWSSPIEYNDYKKAFTILEFHCKDKKKGIGTAVLKEIIQGADLFGYTIFIEPTSMKKYRIETDINTNDLKEWYSKYDFKPLNDNYSDYVWLRNPKNPDIQYAGGGKVKSEYIKRVKEAIEYVENSAKARMIIDFEDEEGSKQAFNEGKDYERIFPIKSKPNSFVVKRIRDGVQEKYDAYGIWNEKTKSYDYQYPKNTKYGDKSKEFETLQIATYDEKGKIVGTIKIATTENKQEDVKKGAFKIAVRQDYQNKGIASKLIEKAESEGIDFLEALKNNKFTSKGRGYFISWLNKKLN